MFACLVTKIDLIRSSIMEGRRILHKEKNTLVSTNYITHFTDTFDKLKGIIENGFKPFSCSESPIYKEEYYELKMISEFLEIEIPELEKVPIPMVCFCDLPIKLSKRHRKKYGSYGISLDKSWAISQEISPVYYITSDTISQRSLFTIYNQTKKVIEKIRQKEDYVCDYPYLSNLELSLSKFWSLIKPYQNRKDNYKYYDEREWRFIPDNYIQAERNNSETYLKFKASDMYQVIITNAKEKRIIRKIISDKFDADMKKDIKIRN